MLDQPHRSVTSHDLADMAEQLIAQGCHMIFVEMARLDKTISISS